MAMNAGDEERQWAAEKRDFVADRRDQLADERDTVADMREAMANAREAALDEREQRLDARVLEFGRPAATATATVERVDAHAGREEARQDREEARATRDAAAAARTEATKRRQEATSTTRLASAFAAIAGHLYAADSFDDVLLRVARTAVSTIAGCDMASVTLSEQGAYQTAATTASAASAVDQAQYDAKQGPCLDAVDDPMVYAPSFPDDRWPRLASRPSDLGAQSAVSYRLTAESLPSTGGSLNTYGSEPDGFNDEAQHIGLILAAHAAIAAGAVHERSALQDLVTNLDRALLSRDVIGQAKGILMERFKITPEDAFDILRHSSQRLNEKLREVAVSLTETGKLNTPGIAQADTLTARPAASDQQEPGC